MKKLLFLTLTLFIACDKSEYEPAPDVIYDFEKLKGTWIRDEPEVNTGVKYIFIFHDDETFSWGEIRTDGTTHLTYKNEKAIYKNGGIYLYNTKIPQFEFLEITPTKYYMASQGQGFIKKTICTKQ